MSLRSSGATAFDLISNVGACARILQHEAGLEPRLRDLNLALGMAYCLAHHLDTSNQGCTNLHLISPTQRYNLKISKIPFARTSPASGWPARLNSADSAPELQKLMRMKVPERPTDLEGSNTVILTNATLAISHLTVASYGCSVGITRPVSASKCRKQTQHLITSQCLTWLGSFLRRLASFQVPSLFLIGESLNPPEPLLRHCLELHLQPSLRPGVFSHLSVFRRGAARFQRCSGNQVTVSGHGMRILCKARDQKKGTVLCRH